MQGLWIWRRTCVSLETSAGCATEDLLGPSSLYAAFPSGGSLPGISCSASSAMLYALILSCASAPGMDAQVAHAFHHLRNTKPHLARGPRANKVPPPPTASVPSLPLPSTTSA